MLLELSNNCIINCPPLIDPKVSSDRDFTRACMSMANDNVPTLLLRASGFLSRTRVSVRMQSSDALHGSRIIYDMQSIANLCHVRFFRALECLSSMAQIERERERKKVCVCVYLLVQVHRNRIELHVLFPCWRVADQSIRARPSYMYTTTQCSPQRAARPAK